MYSKNALGRYKKDPGMPESARHLVHEKLLNYYKLLFQPFSILKRISEPCLHKLAHFCNLQQTSFSPVPDVPNVRYGADVG